MTPPDSSDHSPSDGDKKPGPARRTPPLWRLAFDLVERPVGAASEAWMQSDVFMDALAVTWKVQRRMSREVHRSQSSLDIADGGRCGE